MICRAVTVSNCHAVIVRNRYSRDLLRVYRVLILGGFAHGARRHRALASTTEVSIWRSGMVQYRRSRVDFSSAGTGLNPCNR